jgi:CheY-like chemotaxis protein
MDMNYSVLVAISNRREAHRAAERLRQHGMRTDLAFDGLTAITAFLFAQPDMICIDARLLGQSGEPAFNIFARDALRTSTPVVVLKDPTVYEMPWCDRRTQFVDWGWKDDLADCLEPVIVDHFGLSLTSLNKPAFVSTIDAPAIDSALAAL